MQRGTARKDIKLGPNCEDYPRAKSIDASCRREAVLIRKTLKKQAALVDTVKWFQLLARAWGCRANEKQPKQAQQSTLNRLQTGTDDPSYNRGTQSAMISHGLSAIFLSQVFGTWTKSLVVTSLGGRGWVAALCRSHLQELYLACEMHLLFYFLSCATPIIRPNRMGPALPNAAA
eukprot:5178899-Amphidinium_carterae.1